MLLLGLLTKLLISVMVLSVESGMACHEETVSYLLIVFFFLSFKHLPVKMQTTNDKFQSGDLNLVPSVMENNSPIHCMETCVLCFVFLHVKR